MPRSVRSGTITTSGFRLSAFNADIPDRISPVRSVEWLFTTITLNGKLVFCSKALFTASAIVFSRLKTGMITEAS